MRWIRSAGDSMEVHTDRPGYLGDSACHTAYAKSLSTPEPLEISSMCSAPICSASAPIRASHHCRAYCGLAMGCSGVRSEEHTSELQSLMRISYAVFCLKK